MTKPEIGDEWKFTGSEPNFRFTTTVIKATEDLVYFKVNTSIWSTFPAGKETFEFWKSFDKPDCHWSLVKKWRPDIQPKPRLALITE